MDRNKSGELSGLVNGSQCSTYNSIAPIGLDDISNSDDDEEGSYTELLRGSVPCPTCRGVGNIPKEQEGQLVALIPMKDKRLRPRRTYLWVGLAVFLCILVAGIILFILFPRGVDITSEKPYLNPVGPVYINVTEQYVNFLITNSFNLSNNNYVSIKILSVTMTLLYDTQVLAETTNVTHLDVSMRAENQYSISANVTLDNQNQMGYMAYSCQKKIRWAHEFVVIFQFNCDYEVLGHSEQVTLQTYQFVSCYSELKPSTIKPATTTTTTTKSPPTTTTVKEQSPT